MEVIVVHILIQIITVVYLTHPVESDMCMMIRRKDPAIGLLRWSIPSKKRCSCTRVAIRQSNINVCPGIPLRDLWFTDDPYSLIESQNWTPEKLDALFDRKIACDTEKPAIFDMPVNIVQDTDNGVATSIVNWVEPHATDNSGSETLTSSHSPGSSFSIGITSVEYTSIDPNGNSISATFIVNIQDTEKPAIFDMPVNIVQDTDNGVATSIVNWVEPHATDNSGSETLTSSHSPGSSFSIGITSVEYTSIDPNGNSISATFIVNIQDTEKPVIFDMPANIIQHTVNGLKTAIVNWTMPYATDNSGTQTLTSSHSPGSSFPIGNTSVEYASVDSFGNSRSDAFVITIIATCESSWIANGDFCYYFAHTSLLDFSQAEADCLSMGAFLASVHSVEEQDFMAANVMDNGRGYSTFGYWIGFEDRLEEGTFEWVDGTLANYVNWGDGQPNNYGEQDCGMLWMTEAWKWSDLGCADTNLAHVCKKLLI